MPDRETILLVDDDCDILEGVRFRLQCSGYETIEAQDGNQAIEQAVRGQPDAVLLDVRMPRLDGLDALRVLRSRMETKHIPVVMVSASLSDRKAALSAGARFFLTKPYEPKELLSAIQSVTRRERECNKGKSQ